MITSFLLTEHWNLLSALLGLREYFISKLILLYLAGPVLYISSEQIQLTFFYLSIYYMPYLLSSFQTEHSLQLELYGRVMHGTKTAGKMMAIPRFRRAYHPVYHPLGHRKCQ